MNINDIDINHTKAVIFDFDGTLYDKKGIGWKLVKADFSNAFILLTERIVRANLLGTHFANPDDFYHTLYSEIARRYHCSYIQAHDWFLSSYMPLYAKVLRLYFHVNSWVIPLITQLRERGIKVAMLSDYAFIEEKLEALDIPASLFDVIASAPLLGGLKPCKQTGDKMIEWLQTKPEETLMVGDRLKTDGQLAENCGMKFYLIFN